MRRSPGTPSPRRWYSRGYLPHYNNPETIQSVVLFVRENR